MATKTATSTKRKSNSKETVIKPKKLPDYSWMTFEQLDATLGHVRGGCKFEPLGDLAMTRVCGRTLLWNRSGKFINIED